MIHADFVLGYITCPTTASAERIAQQLLGQRLIGCANILESVRSVYWWQGKIAESKEVLLLVKTHATKQEAIITAVKAIHEYTMPCVVFYPMLGGDTGYLAWLGEMLT